MSDATTSLYLEDFHVGLRMTTDTHALDTAQIKAFAGQFDPQPFHLDEAAAERSFFKTLVASGWHTAAITMRLLATMKPGISGGMIGASARGALRALRIPRAARRRAAWPWAG